MTTTQQDVVVVGAGPTGLTVACELARRGVAVTVLDGAHGPRAGSRGKGVQPRTLEHLDRLGLAGRLVSLGTSALAVRHWSEGPDGEPAGTDAPLDGYRAPTPDTPYPSALLAPQWRTEQVLREHLAELGVEVSWGNPVTGVVQDADGVAIELGDTSFRASYVVGCDGGSSAVRRATGIPFLGETHDDIRMLLGDVVVEGLDRDHWHQWRDPFTALCPLPATEDFQFQGADPNPATDREPTIEDYREALERCGAHGVRVREVRWSSRWRLNVRMVERYRDGRVLLAGDAAHVHSPAGAQGMNTGIGDGVALGWRLAAVLSGAGDALLDGYQAERLPIAAEVLGLSGRLSGRPITERGADGVTARQLGLTYRGGPLAAGPDGRRPAGAEPAADDPGPGPRSGDRAPDAPVRTPEGRRTRLFEVFRDPGWVLLGFDVRPPSRAGVRAVTLLSAGAKPDRDAALVDAAGHAATAYEPYPGELVLIRPDGHVGLRTGDPAAVDRYLDGLVAATAPVG